MTASPDGTALEEAPAASKRVLMVLYHFPPLGGVPVARNVRNVEYLPRFGWTPIVLAPRKGDGPADPATLGMVSPDATVVRTGFVGPEVLRPVVNLAKHLRPRASRTERADGAPTAIEPPAAGRPGSSTIPSFWHLQQLVFFPDSEIGWLVFAVVGAVRAYWAGRFDAIYSTSSPVTAHLIAGIVKRITGAPWVAEFRDPWKGNPVAARPPWFHRQLQAHLERWVVRSADRIVFVSPSTARLYRRRYPQAAEMTTIMNAYDPADTLVPAARPAADRDLFRIVWTGTIYRPAELEVVLEGLKSMVASRPALADTLRLTFYGLVSDESRHVADRVAADGSLDGVIDFRGFVPRKVALQAIADADAALVMLGGGPGMGQFVPGKLFDYLGQNKQILAVLPPGDARDILEELRWGVIADPDATSVCRAIERLLAMPAPHRPADPAGAYSRLAMAERLAGVLDRAAQSRRDHAPGREPARRGRPR